MKRILPLFLVLLLMLPAGCKKQPTETASPGEVVEKEETGTSDTVVEKEEADTSIKTPSEPERHPAVTPESEPEEESPQPVAPESDEEGTPSPEEEEKATRIEENFCAPKLEDSFVPGEILITIKKEYSEPNKIWSASDFSELEILSVEDLFTIDNESALAWINKDQFQQILKLTLASPTKEAVIETIPKLSIYDFIQTAGANYIDSLW